MVDTNKLRGIIAENGKTQTEVAQMIGVTPKTFYLRMHKGVFGSNEIQIMIDNLNIENPMEIFFCKESNFISYQKGEKMERELKELIQIEKKRNSLLEEINRSLKKLASKEDKEYQSEVGKSAFNLD